VRFLFTTIQFAESEGYRLVGEALRARGHDPAHVTISRRAAADIRAGGTPAQVLPELVEAAGGYDVAAETARIERTYPIGSLRSVYNTDVVCRGRDETWCVDRTIRHFRALERVFDAFRPDALIPEVGSETFRTVAHAIALARGIPVLFLFFTIFPNSLRLYVDEPQARIVPDDEVRPLDAAERAEVEAFVAAFIARDQPLLPHRRSSVTSRTLAEFGRHIVTATAFERDNEYLHPTHFVRNTVVQRSRAAAARSLYQEIDSARRYVYFPLHVTDDFKIKRMIPHCVDQAAIIEQVSDALPQGIDIVLKEHPRSLGRNPLSFLRRLARRDNIRLVDPYASSHELIRDSAAVVVIGSTVGVEALLHGKPVLTLGQPWYGGYGVTVDVDSFREIRSAVLEVLGFQPDRERTLQFLAAAMRSTFPGKPASLDRSPENVARLADSIEAVAAREAQRRGALQPA
jgi:hypothetical protein